MEKQLEPTATVERGLTVREEFSAQETQKQGETAALAVISRERVVIEAQYLMAERHPRNWLNVRGAILDHCNRPRFAEVSRYSRPVGKEKVNGEWVDKIARGFTVRFAETLAQEMGNVKPEAAVTYEDDLIRIVRFTVTDLQRNLPRSREVAFAKTVEKRGFQNKKTRAWEPPEGRRVISSRLNTDGEPVYLVQATEDELRSKVNREESRTQRDFITRLCPRDILEECEDRLTEVIAREDKRDPGAALKKLLDRFREFGIQATDLETYIAKPAAQFTTEDISELRGLGAAIRDQQTTFDAALKAKWAQAGEGAEQTEQQHDARLRRQMSEQAAKAGAQAATAERKIADLEADSASAPGLQRITSDDIRRVMPAEPPAVPEFPDPQDPNYEHVPTVSRGGVIYRRSEDNTGWQPLPKTEPKTEPSRADKGEPVAGSQSPQVARTRMEPGAGSGEEKVAPPRSRLTVGKKT